MKKYLFLILPIIWQSLGFSAVTAKLRSSHIQKNEPFYLILSTDSVHSGEAPDLSVLQQDFFILGTESNMSYSMINGQTTSLNQWIVLLRPKKEGKLPIPAIKIGSERTQPTVIDVEGSSPQEATATSTDDPQETTSDNVTLKVTTSEQAPYVNQQVLYTVKLYSAQRLVNAEYHPPQVEDALLVPLGTGRHYQTQIKDQLYGVEEQQYAIFPQKSGSLTITPPSLDAEVYDGFPRHITVKGTPTTLSIRPAPTDYKAGNWLPTKKLTLVETYDPPLEKLKQGDTITRTITLSATAMPAQLLPTLILDKSKMFSTYPENPEVKNTVKSNELIGTSTTKITYLLNQSGNITIPALEVPWFNTTTGKTETASLPAHTITIEPNGQAESEANKADLPQAHKVKKTADTATLSVPATIRGSFLAGFALATGILALLWWFLRNPSLKRSKDSQIAIKRFQDACQKNRPAAARQALLIWAQAQWPEAAILNLQDVATRTRDAHLKKHLLLLTEALYDASKKATWQGGETLWQSFNTYRQTHIETKSNFKSKKANLPPINPV